MKKILLSSLFGLALASCNLDLLPENSLTYTNSFRSETELNATTTSIHFYLNTTLGNNFALTLAGIKTDEVQSSEQIRQWNPRSVLKSGVEWKGFYDMIFEANLLRDNIYRTQGLSTDRYNYHLGQAEFALGLGYFVLAQRYGDVIITENSSTIKAYPTSPQLQVLNTAIEHAKKGYDLLPTFDKLRNMDGTTVRNRQIASKGSCAALLAHLYAWKGSVTELYGLAGNAQEDYRNAVEYATQLIEGKVGAYALCDNPEQLCDYLSNPEKANPEAIFSLYFDRARSVNTTSPNEVARGFVSWPVNETQTLSDINVQTTYRLHKETIDGLFPDASDLRLQAFFYQYNTLHTVDGVNYAIMYKFRNAIIEPDEFAPGGKSYLTINADYVYWRLADIYLLRAECNAKLQNDAAAIADLNVIRNRAGASSYPSTYDTDGLKKAIFREREKEFIGENDARYADVIRNNYIKEELQGKFKVLTTQEIKNGALFLPLPNSAWQERDGKVVNTLLRQKPYWAAYE